MSFLDDLKRQAEALQAQKSDGQRFTERTVRLVEGAGREVNAYLMELAAQLDTIKPPSTRQYTLDKGVTVTGVPMVDFRFDARRTIVLDLEVIDHVYIGCSIKSGRQVRLSKDFINGMEQLEARLTQAGIAYEREPVRRPEDGKLAAVRYDFTADIQVSAMVTCKHDVGSLQFKLRNIDGLETVDCEFPAHEVTKARLDELARWFVGQPNRFLDRAQGVRRVEAR